MISEHLKKALWEQIWFEKNGYYNALSPDVRKKISALHLELLDQQRSAISVVSGGDPLPPGDSTNIPKPVEPVPVIPDPSSIHDPRLYSFGEKKLWIPWAKEIDSGVRRGTRSKRYPDGALVHFTAGHRDGLKAGAELMTSSGMNYFILDKDGNMGQPDPLSEWGYHGGESRYPGLNGSVSDELVGIEIQAAGSLRKNGDFFYPWWDGGKNLPGNRIPDHEVVYSPKRGNIAPGFYQEYTQAQVLALRKGICWLHLNHPDVFKIKFVVGHDEVSPGRKNDPGAALVNLTGIPITMDDFRDWVADDVRMIMANRK